MLARMPTINLPLDEMTLDEKLRLMEAIWENLSRNPDDVPSPDWHGEVLRETLRQLDAGETDFIPWEEAKANLQRRAEARRQQP